MSRSQTPVLVLVLAVSLAAGLEAQSITLSPAVVPLRGAPGESVTQTLTLENGAGRELAFTLAAEDVVVRDGARVFVAAGELADSIAATAVFTPRELRIADGGKGSVQVTLTLPPNLRHRAARVLFRAATPLPAGGRPAYLSLGTLFTFAVSDRVSVDAAALEATPPSASANARLASSLRNDGDEPVEPRGMAVILDAAGALVGKTAFPVRRLLPGEIVTVAAEYPGELRAGSYQAIATFDVGGRAVTRSGELVVP